MKRKIISLGIVVLAACLSSCSLSNPFASVGQKSSSDEINLSIVSPSSSSENKSSLEETSSIEVSSASETTSSSEIQSSETNSSSDSVSSSDSISSSESSSDSHQESSLDSHAYQFEDDLSFNFLELGNIYNGDSTYIKAGDIDILIDAGSRKGSATTLETYINQYCTDGVLEYVITTHAHQDHIAGMVGTKTSGTDFFGNSTSQTGIMYYYKIGTIIDFDLTNASTISSNSEYSAIYVSYLEARNYAISKGAVHYTASQCVQGSEGAKQTYQLTNTISMKILNSYYYTNEASDENDYSVCALFTQVGTYETYNYLLTGDLEKSGESYLTTLNTLPHVKLFKGGHHGSGTANTENLLSVITPEIVCICCCAGSVEYTQDLDNSMMYQETIDRLAKYTTNIYATTCITSVSSNGTKYVNDGYQSLNGNIKVFIGKEGLSLNCSSNNTKLKDSTWFNSLRPDGKPWRTWPNTTSTYN